MSHTSAFAEANEDQREGSSSYSEGNSINEVIAISKRRVQAIGVRAFLIRTLALLCVCSLSVGSHYASYILGPIKSRLSRELGTSHTEFSLLISAFSLNSTWTPLVGGVLASRLGTTFTSILATGVIFLGQILLLTGDIWGNVRLMALGMFIFGLGVSPLAVVQETIIVRFFKSHGLGVSMAFGLLAGKGASFVSARTSYPLTERFGMRAPFYVATSLAGISVIVNLTYILASRWFVDGSGAELEAPDIEEEARRRSTYSLTEAQALEKVADHRRVRNLREVTKLGDLFWTYVGFNVLCGMIWSPFTHLAANIIQGRYHMTEQDAANQASYLLAGSLVLYPICGYVVDRYKDRPIVLRLLTLSSVLTLSAYIWLALPPAWTHASYPAISIYGAGQGFAPLLLVVIVPQIVPTKYISTALGVHKSLEQTGSTIFQTFAGLELDTAAEKSDPHAPEAPSQNVQRLLNTFVCINILQFLFILGMTYLRNCDQPASGAHRSSQIETSHDHLSEAPEAQPLLSSSEDPHRCYSVASHRDGSIPPTVRPGAMIRRGELFAAFCATLIAFAWILFMGTAWFRLRSKEGRSLVG